MINRMKFKASLGNNTKLVSLIFTIGFILLITFQFFIFDKYPNKIVPIIIVFLLLLCFFIVFFLRPIGYLVTAEKIIIQRILHVINIDRRNIVSVSLIDKNELNGFRRLMGNEGLFGYYGSFYQTDFGEMVWYATRLENFVLIKTTTSKPILLTPDNPVEFVKYLNNEI